MLKRPKIFLLEKISSLLRKKSFYVQGRMDIDKLSLWYDKEFNDTTGGFYLVNDNIKREIVELPLHDNTRKDMLILLLRSITERKVPGFIAELGVYKGETAKLMHYYLPERKLYLFDTFQGFDATAIKDERRVTNLAVDENDFTNTSISKVKKYITPLNENLIIMEGNFPETVLDIEFPEGFAFVHLDADLYTSTKNGLNYFYPKMNKGGFILIHDYNAWPGARKAVDEFSEERTLIPIPLPDKSGSCLILIN
jgi:O-methyltransferase